MAKPRLAADYEDDITAASRSALAEVMLTLGAYRDALVLIGGWAPPGAIAPRTHRHDLGAGVVRC